MFNFLDRHPNSNCIKKVVEMNPGDALYANLARLSYSASLRAQVINPLKAVLFFLAGNSNSNLSKAALRRAASRLTVGEVLQLALLFCFPWFLGNYCYQAALSETEAAVVQASDNIFEGFGNAPSSLGCAIPSPGRGLNYTTLESIFCQTV